MGRKYVIELEDEPFVQKSFLNTDSVLWRVKGFNSLVLDEEGIKRLLPYTGETENDAYCKGYDEGMRIGRIDEQEAYYKKGLEDAYGSIEWFLKKQSVKGDCENGN